MYLRLRAADAPLPYRVNLHAPALPARLNGPTVAGRRKPGKVIETKRGADRTGVCEFAVDPWLAAIEPLESRTHLSANWFVAPTGSDQNPGTLAAPFKTIQHAAIIAQAGDHVKKSAPEPTTKP